MKNHEKLNSREFCFRVFYFFFPILISKRRCSCRCFYSQEIKPKMDQRQYPSNCIPTSPLTNINSNLLSDDCCWVRGWVGAQMLGYWHWSPKFKFFHRISDKCYLNHRPLWILNENSVLGHHLTKQSWYSHPRNYIVLSYLATPLVLENSVSAFCFASLSVRRWLNCRSSFSAYFCPAP